MPPLRRHQLAYLTSAGWHSVLERPWETAAAVCLRQWARRRLPVVVTRQPADASAPPRVNLGLQPPLAVRHCRLAFDVAPADIAFFDEFPLAARTLALLPENARDGVERLLHTLNAQRASARVYGSFGWQQLSGRQHVHPGSDLDLWVAVEDPDHADIVARMLDTCAPGALRLDGELMFPDGTAVAWREWLLWRTGKQAALLVKRLHGPSLLEASGAPRTLPWAMA